MVGKFLHFIFSFLESSLFSHRLRFLWLDFLRRISSALFGRGNRRRFAFLVCADGAVISPRSWRMPLVASEPLAVRGTRQNAPFRPVLCKLSTTIQSKNCKQHWHSGFTNVLVRPQLALKWNFPLAGIAIKIISTCCTSPSKRRTSKYSSNRSILYCIHSLLYEIIIYSMYWNRERI